MLYLVNESDGAIDLDYAYLFALQRGVTTHTQPCAVLGDKFAHLRGADRKRDGERVRQASRRQEKAKHLRVTAKIPQGYLAKKV